MGNLRGMESFRWQSRDSCPGLPVEVDLALGQTQRHDLWPSTETSESWLMAVRSKGRMVRCSLEVESSREIRVRDEAFEKLKMRSSQEMEVWKRVVCGR